MTADVMGPLEKARAIFSVIRTMPDAMAANAAATLALAEEQRTANLLALLAVRPDLRGLRIDDRAADLLGEILTRLGVTS